MLLSDLRNVFQFRTKSPARPGTYGEKHNLKTQTLSPAALFAGRYMSSDFLFMRKAICITLFHKRLDPQGPIHLIDDGKDGFSVCRHRKEIGVDTAALFSGEIWVNPTQARVPHDALYDHFA